jgi:hypothetical protein
MRLKCKQQLLPCNTPLWRIWVSIHGSSEPNPFNCGPACLSCFSRPSPMVVNPNGDLSLCSPTLALGPRNTSLYQTTSSSQILSLPEACSPHSIKTAPTCPCTPRFPALQRPPILAPSPTTSEYMTPASLPSAPRLGTSSAPSPPLSALL